MREILFKAKRVKNGEWIEGSLIDLDIDQRGEDATEHVYEVMALYPYCVLLRDTRNGVRTCPGYNTLSLMLRGSEVNE